MNKSNKQQKQQKKGNKNSSRGSSKTSKHIQIYDHPGRITSMSTAENRIYTYVQNASITYTLTQRQTLETALGFQFVFTDMDNYTNFAGLYDQYRFDEIQIIIRPAYTSQPLSAGVTKVPLLYTVIDYDDAAANLTTSAAKEYSNVGVSLYETVVVKFKPHIATAAYNGAFTGYANEAARWIDVASTNVQHYGVKVVCEAGLSTQTQLQQWDISTMFRISFRNVR